MKVRYQTCNSLREWQKYWLLNCLQDKEDTSKITCDTSPIPTLNPLN